MEIDINVSLWVSMIHVQWDFLFVFLYPEINLTLSSLLIIIFFISEAVQLP